MKKKESARKKRHNRIKRKMCGTADTPRVYLFRSLKNIFAVGIDDTTHKVLFSASTLDKAVIQKAQTGGNIKAAESLGEMCARKIQEKGIKRIVFDRSGYLYHGRVKAFAEAMRKGGLTF